MKNTLLRSLGAILLAALAAGPVRAGNVDQNDVSSFVDRRPLLRVDYANDFFTASDRYYTNGIGVEFFHPALKQSPLMRALFGLPGGADSYGLSVRQSAFTPSRVGEMAAIPNDRPWAAYAYLGHLRVSKDPSAGLTLTTELDAGILGPPAGGKMQKWLHQRLGMHIPRGWDNQIRDDAVLDYYARLEKILRSAPWWDFGVYGDATAGTLYDNAAAGLSARLGRVDPARKNKYFVFGRGEGKLVGYDATLQGGLFNRPQSYYMTPDSQVNRLVYRWDVGLALDFDTFVLQVTRSAIGREFSGAVPHHWAELTFMKRF